MRPDIGACGRPLQLRCGRHDIRDRYCAGDHVKGIASMVHLYLNRFRLTTNYGHDPLFLFISYSLQIPNSHALSRERHPAVRLPDKW